MKTRYILFAFCITAMVACEKRLDLSPLNNPTVNTFYKTPADAAAAIAGIYATLQEVYTHEAIVTPNTVGADDAIPFLQGNADRRALWSYTFVTSNSFVTTPWRLSYQGIQRANVAIARLPGIAMDENLKKRYIAEAKFLRAMFYFDLVRFYGGVPIVANETMSLDNVTIPRNSKEEVYSFIEADLQAAADVLPLRYQGADVGRATRGAAMGVMAKAFLTQAGNNTSSPFWAKAAAKAKEVMDLNTYGLWDDYADVFDIKNKGGKESVFEVMYLTDVAGNWHTTYWAPRGDPRVPGNGFGTIRPTKSLYDLFGNNDKRKPVTFLTSYVNPTTGATVSLSIDDPNPALAISFWKLADMTSKVGGGGGKSFPYLRYADILLMFAEATNEASGPTNEAHAALNLVRTRAGLDALDNQSVEQLREAILTERRREFALEGHRWFDLVRRNRLVQAVQAETTFGRNPQIKAFNVLFPIPQREIGANPALVQNQGY